MFYFFQYASVMLMALLFTSEKRNCMPLPDRKIQNSNMPDQADTSGVIAAGATLQLISGQFGFTEGPAVDAGGNIFFTDQPNDAIWQYKTDGALSLFLSGTGRSNGLYIDKKGNIIACADEKGEVWQISPEKKISVLYKAKEKKQLNGPNDLWIDSKGGIYITDPYYQRPYWKRKAPVLKNQSVYYLPHGKKKLVEVENGIKQPNGIVGTPDGKWLYIADIGDSKIYKYEIQQDGTLKNRQLFIAQICDGMALDNRGNLYITGNGVTVYNADGKKIEHIDIPAKWTSNVCFGGKEKNSLFITASEGIYIIQMNVTGVE